jgi:hypothetical protein
MKLTGENRSTRKKKPCPSATLSTIKPTWTDPGSNPGLRIMNADVNEHTSLFLLNLFCYSALLSASDFGRETKIS